eukprot:TRINITY_DN13284_c0_g1_i1.p1 TRINITY_DN13284_c0_g1~~TRINITY_DN13284_c0_g1_i1.p1  ORF type:complete len:124 (+),score=38.99 TRINITY_DN13284_c0_g1_i1:49-420(+)
MSDAEANPTQTETTSIAPKTRRVSGRGWKEPYSKKHVFADKKIFKKTWDQKQADRNHLKAVKAMEKELKDRIKEEREQLKKNTEDNIKRREENERKAEVYQVVRNASKIKKMSKKQLQKLQKR